MKTTEKTWIGVKEIAGLLDVTPSTFHRNLTRLTDREGFPLPSSHRIKPRTWRREAVLHWIDSQSYSRNDLYEVPPQRNDRGAQVHLMRMARAV